MSITAFTANVSQHRAGNFLSCNHRKPILLREKRELGGAESEISQEGPGHTVKITYIGMYPTDCHSEDGEFGNNIVFTHRN